jgi:periplasmic protein TonB
MTPGLAGLPFKRGNDAHDIAPWGAVQWALCFLAVVLLHAAIVWIVLPRQSTGDAAPPTPPAAVMIDLAPLSAAPPMPPSEVAPGPKQEIAQTPPPEPAVQPVLTPVPPAPEPLAQPILPSVPPTSAPVVDVPLPPTPKPAPPSPPKRHQQFVPHRPPAPHLDIKSPAPDTTAPPTVEAPASPTASARSPSLAPAHTATAVPTWQGLLLSRLEQFKRYPAAAQYRHQQGVAYLRFTMDRKGNVLSARVEKSSGVASLDEETLALIHRAEPLPVPPPDVAGDPIELVVPVEFRLR